MARLQELATLDNQGGGIFSLIAGNRFKQLDEHTLARLGKKQVLKV